MVHFYIFSNPRCTNATSMLMNKCSSHAQRLTVINNCKEILHNYRHTRCVTRYNCDPMDVFNVRKEKDGTVGYGEHRLVRWKVVCWVGYWFLWVVGAWVGWFIYLQQSADCGIGWCRICWCIIIWAAAWTTIKQVSNAVYLSPLFTLRTTLHTNKRRFRTGSHWPTRPASANHSVTENVWRATPEVRPACLGHKLKYSDCRKTGRFRTKPSDWVMPVVIWPWSLRQESRLRLWPDC